MRRVVALIVVFGLAACGGNAGPDPEVMPSDFQVNYHWDSGVSNVGPDYLAYRISLSTTGSATVSYTIGHPSSNDQEEWADTFEFSIDDLRELYTTMHEVGVFTRDWTQADPIPGIFYGSRVHVVAGGEDYSVPSALADSSEADLVASVYEEIRGLVPETIWDTMEARQAQYIEKHDL
jgi:hypothetical protein